MAGRRIADRPAMRHDGAMVAEDRLNLVAFVSDLADSLGNLFRRSPHVSRNERS
jgi:hypothetical protein